MQKIRDLRKKKGITAIEMAKWLEISTGNYYKKEMGTIKFSIDELILISFVLKENLTAMIFDKILEVEKEWRKKTS
jgi:DNA-binding XRE family transcriptional regulator